jgi:hypothetical protein
MKAQHLVNGASFGPEALKVIGRAFDKAWEEIGGNFGNDPIDIEAARLKLASVLLSIATEDSRDVEALKNSALQAIALRYREPPDGTRAEPIRSASAPSADQGLPR